MNNKSVKLNLIIAVSVFAVTAIFFVFRLVNTKKKVEEFNAVVGKNEAVTVTQAAQTLLNDDKTGTFEENVKFENTRNKKDGVIEIKEKLFLAQTSDVYLNPDDYLGKTIKLEGIFMREQFAGTDYCFVIRYGPGCCGNDGNAGFQVAWNKPALTEPYPAAGEWVGASGVLSTYTEDGNPYLYLDLINLTVMDKRGAEFVRQ
ncbi:MAG: hypothetical protein LBG72_02095 [Spirochaetaceae bacterium]|jgi:uncharacterized membrane protein YcgQ (UPF0703/DUF1980 family)|nr:hypothetical protein [Spirochaetaceae bacterium]